LNQGAVSPRFTASRLALSDLNFALDLNFGFVGFEFQQLNFGFVGFELQRI
jgi:hypothetical protein